MKRWLPFLILACLINGCKTDPTTPFEVFLGPEKGGVLQEAKMHYHLFLNQNFTAEDPTEETLQFLKYVSTDTAESKLLRLNFLQAADIVSNYESSELRHDYMLLGLEAYDSLFKFDLATGKQSIAHTSTLETLELDLGDEPNVQDWDSTYITWLEERIADFEREASTHYHPNKFGRFQFGLKKFYGQDPVVKKYLQLYSEETTEAPSPEVARFLIEALEQAPLTEGVTTIILFEVYLPYLLNEVGVQGLHIIDMHVE